MNNEPVALRHNCPHCEQEFTCNHPVKTLTDFEIKGVLALDECWIGEDSSMPNMIAFARAILKRASEK